MKISITSEIEKISSVIVQRPGLDHDKMHPSHIQEYLNDGTENSEYLLFDDLVDTQLAIQEHDDFTSIIKLFTGTESCIYLDDLINELNFLLEKQVNPPLLEVDSVSSSQTHVSEGCDR